MGQPKDIAGNAEGSMTAYTSFNRYAAIVTQMQNGSARTKVAGIACGKPIHMKSRMMQDGRLCLCRTTLCQSDTENSSSAALLYGRPRLPQ